MSLFIYIYVLIYFYVHHASLIIFRSHLQKIYELLKQRVEMCPVAPIPQEWLDSVGDRIPQQLKEHAQSKKQLKDLYTELCNNFSIALVTRNGISYCLLM